MGELGQVAGGPTWLSGCTNGSPAHPQLLGGSGWRESRRWLLHFHAGVLSWPLMERAARSGLLTQAPPPLLGLAARTEAVGCACNLPTLAVEAALSLGTGERADGPDHRLGLGTVPERLCKMGNNNNTCCEH